MSHSHELRSARPWVVVALLFTATGAHGGGLPPWDGAPFTAEPAALASAAASLRTPPVGERDVLLDELRARLDERGALTTVRRVVYRVAGPDAGPGAGRVEAAWAPAIEERPRVRARVVGPDASVHALDPATLAESPAPFTAGRSVLSGLLPGVAAGAVVEVEITVRGRAPAGDAGGVLRLPLAGPDPVRRLRIELSAPARLPLRWRVRAAQARPQESVASGTRRLLLERRDLPPAPAPVPGAPRELPAGPELAVAWGGSWREVAERAGAVFAASLGTSDLGAAVQAAAGEARERDEIVRRVAAWIHQNVRSTGVSLAESGLAPAPPAETLRRREGSGEDLALLLVALLRARGLEARPVLVRGAWDEVVPDLPGLGGFDHTVVRVEGKPQIWIDPGDPGTPPGSLPAALQGRLALPLGPGVRGLVRSPASTADQNRLRVERELLLARLGRGTVVETRELAGAPAEAERTLRQALAPEDRDELDQRHAREVLRGEDLVYASVEGAEDASAPLRVKMEARGSEAVLTGDEGAAPSVPADQVFELLPRALTGAPGADEAPAPRRRAELLLAFPFRAELVYRVVPPDGWRVTGLPPASEERFGPVRLRSEFSTEPGGAAVARYQLDCERRLLSAAEADGLARRIRAIRHARGPAIPVERISAALFREGRVAEALAELRAVAARHRDDVIAAGQHALGLLRMGFTSAAEAEMRRVLELQPSSGWGHRVLGLVLEHDELGRYRGPGFRRMAALAAYRRARQLDPGNAAARAQLADLLARDAAGRPAAEQRTAAVLEYEALARDLGDHGHDPARLELLFDLGRYDDAVALARERPSGGVRDAVFLAATAALEGGAAAGLREARKLGEERTGALRDAARLLLRAGRYPAAAALARANADATPDAPGVREQAEMLARLEAWKRSHAHCDGGEWTLRRLVHLGAVSPEPLRELAPLLAPWLDEGSAEQVRRSLAAPFRAMRRSAAEQGTPPTVLADLLLSGLVLDREGDRATGERVRLRFGPGRSPPVLTVFLAPAGAEERILATEATWPALVVEADRRAAAGDLAGARRWLSFTREALEGAEDEGGPASVLAALAPAGTEAGAAQIRLTAAALLGFGDPEGRSIPALVAARQQARAGQRRPLGFALAAAYRAAARWPELAGVSAELAAEDPRSREAGALHALALARLGRRDELRAAAEQAEARAAEDPQTAASLASAELSAGDLAGSLATYRSVIGAGRAGAGVYNDAAWLELFQDPPGPDALEWARQATASPSPSHAALNTLAAVHGLLGQAAEAREALVRSLEVAGRKAPEPSDWLAQGLLAEACGLPALAREAYARVTPEPDDPSAPYLLARRRLAALDAPRPPPPPPPAPPPEVAPPPATDPAAPSPPPARKRTPEKSRPPLRPARATPA